MSTRPKPLPFSETLPILLLRARRAVTDHFRPAFQAYGVTEQQWRVLRVVSEVVEIEMTSLAEGVFLSAPSLSRIVRDLIGRGLLRRRTGEQDQRLGLVSITTAGVDLIHRIAPGAFAAMDEVNRRYGPERMARIRQLLLELEDAMLDAPAANARARRPSA